MFLKVYIHYLNVALIQKFSQFTLMVVVNLKDYLPYLKTHGIEHLVSPPYTPKRVAEA